MIQFYSLQRFFSLLVSKFKLLLCSNLRLRTLSQNELNSNVEKLKWTKIKTTPIHSFSIASPTTSPRRIDLLRSFNNSERIILSLILRDSCTVKNQIHSTFLVHDFPKKCYEFGLFFALFNAFVVTAIFKKVLWIWGVWIWILTVI
jgi:hypothetical protein